MPFFFPWFPWVSSVNRKVGGSINTRLWLFDDFKVSDASNQSTAHAFCLAVWDSFGLSPKTAEPADGHAVCLRFVQLECNWNCLPFLLFLIVNELSCIRPKDKLIKNASPTMFVDDFPNLPQERFQCSSHRITPHSERHLSNQISGRERTVISLLFENIFSSSFKQFTSVNCTEIYIWLYSRPWHVDDKETFPGCSWDFIPSEKALQRAGLNILYSWPEYRIDQDADFKPRIHWTLAKYCISYDSCVFENITSLNIETVKAALLPNCQT